VSLQPLPVFPVKRQSSSCRSKINLAWSLSSLASLLIWRERNGSKETFVGKQKQNSYFAVSIYFAGGKNQFGQMARTRSYLRRSFASLLFVLSSDEIAFASLLL
jgi:hypothetical protein